MESYKEFINEAINLSVKDAYGKTIWNEYQKEILAMVNKINKSYFDGRSSGIICDGLAEIFTALGESEDPKILKEIDPKG
jgi:hypothetical protein